MELPQAWKDHDKKIRPYLWSHRAVSFLSFLLLLGFLFVLYSGTGRAWDLRSQDLVSSKFLAFLLFFLGVGVVWELVSFPFSVAAHFIERHFKQSKQAYGSWFWDKVKGWLVGSVIGLLVLGALYFSVQQFGQNWWIMAATLLVLFSVLLAQLAPILLIPIFLKLEPMEEGPLKTRLLELCKRFNVEVKNVYHLGLSDKTEKGNAAFTGLGRTKRILIGDTLYKKHSPEEVEAVFSHELGHQVHQDVWRGILISTVSLFLAFFLVDRVMQTFGGDVNSGFGLFDFFVILSIAQIPLGWFSLAHSRQREREADRFALETIGVGKPLGDSLEKLTFQNQSLFKPNPIVEFFRYSHPAPWRRIMRMRAAK